MANTHRNEPTARTEDRFRSSSFKQREDRLQLQELRTARRPSPVRYEGEARLQASASCRTLSRAEEVPKSNALESKAFAMAMNALQEKARQLELENARISQENEKLRSQDQRRLRELEKMRTEMWERTEKSNRETEQLKAELLKAKDLIERVQLHQTKLQRASKKEETRKGPQREGLKEASAPQQSQRSISTISLPQFAAKQESIDSSVAPLDTSTRRLEREIEEYSRQYKALVQRSKEPGADLLGLRVELNSIAAAMEAKNNHLATIRRQISRDLGAQL